MITFGEAVFGLVGAGLILLLYGLGKFMPGEDDFMGG